MASKKPVKLLSGGNPQIPKGDGDAPVQAYIDALPGWKHDAATWLDAVIVKAVPGVQKAIKWNTAFYGLEGGGFFVGFHALTKYLKISFFRGADLKPLPPGESKVPGTRYYDLSEDDPRDEKQLAKWLKQAAKLPGWKP